MPSVSHVMLKSSPKKVAVFMERWDDPDLRKRLKGTIGRSIFKNMIWDDIGADPDPRHPPPHSLAQTFKKVRGRNNAELV